MIIRNLKILKIGNSYGVIIPKAYFTTRQLDPAKNVDLMISQGTSDFKKGDEVKPCPTPWFPMRM